MKTELDSESFVASIKENYGSNLDYIKMSLKRKSIPFDLFYDFNQILEKIVKASFGKTFSHKYYAVDEGRYYGDLRLGCSPGLIAKPYDGSTSLRLEEENCITRNNDGSLIVTVAQLGNPVYVRNSHISCGASDGRIIAIKPFLYDEAKIYAQLYLSVFDSKKVLILSSKQLDGLNPNGPKNDFRFREIRLSRESLVLEDKLFSEQKDSSTPIN